jgi:putative heme iron utilization protein
VRERVRVQVEDAEIVGLDKIGMDLMVKVGDDTWRQRLPFVYPATDRKKVKEVLVDMTKTAQAAAGAAKEE